MMRFFQKALQEYEEALSRGHDVQANFLAVRLRACWPPAFFAEAEKRGRIVPDYDRNAPGPSVGMWCNPVEKTSFLLAHRMLMVGDDRVGQA